MTVVRRCCLVVGALAGLTPSLDAQRTRAPRPVPPASAPATARLARDERTLLDAVSAERIRAATVRLTAPDFGGRGTGQPGSDRAAEWLAGEFKSMGLAPAGDSGSWFQTIAFRRARLLPATTLRTPLGAFMPGPDFVLATPFPDDSLVVAGDIVFVGYGAQSATLKRDDLKDVDVKGKMVVVLAGRPAGVDSATWEAEAGQQRTIGGLVFRGAKVLLIANAGTKEQPYPLLANYLMRDKVTIDRGPVRAGGPVAAVLSDDAVNRLLGGAYADVKRRADAGEFVSRVLATGAVLDVRAVAERSTGRNVAAVLPGRDSTRKGEAVLFTAHYDAYGTDAQGRVFPGAADNALGTAELLATAAAFAQQPQRTRRSLLFLAVTGEEYGLLGAEAWAAKPTWPLASVAADLNLDGIGSEVYAPVGQAVGFGAELSSLGPMFSRAAAELGVAVGTDPFPEEKVFERSDHFAFVKKGVPSLMLLGAPAGTDWVARAKRWMEVSGDYHQPGDTVHTDWEWRGPRTIAQLMALIGRRVAEQDAMPAWNPGTPFDRPRGGALRE